MTSTRRRVLLALVTAVATSTCAVVAADRPLPLEPNTLDARIHEIYPQLDEVYKDLHRHPELAFQEHRTAALLSKQMRRNGFKVTEGIGRTGLVALFENGPGPTVMIRTELDALPLEEKTHLPYASVVNAAPTEEGGSTPVMHACGHDLHMTAWLGTAEILVALRDQWHGTLMFIAQPAEETVSGARAMLDDGLFTRFRKPNYAFALHVSEAPAGSVLMRAGTISSAVDNLEVTFHGRGGHGATPSLAIDPIVIAARFVTDVQSIVSREKDAGTFGVITVGAFHAGAAGNIIPDSADLKLTLRSHSSVVRRLLLEGVVRVAQASATIAGAPAPTVKKVSGTGAVHNDEHLTADTAAVLAQVFGERFRLSSSSEPPVPASEDFAEYTDSGIPSAYFGIGAYDPATIAATLARGETVPTVHSPLFAPTPEPTVVTGIKALTYATLNVLSENRRGSGAGELSRATPAASSRQ